MDMSQPLVLAELVPIETLERLRLMFEATVGVPQRTPELVRALAELAGVHVFAQNNAAVWANEQFLSVQVHEAGPLTIDTGRTGPVTDALDGAAIGSGPKVTIELEKGDTRVLKY